MKIDCSNNQCNNKVQITQETFLCHICKQANYCSKKCKEFDWIMFHSQFCQYDFDNYTKLQELGSGTYGRVFLVQKENKFYALKIIPKGIFIEINDYQLQREISIHKKLHHQNIIQLYAYHQDRQNVSLLMEYAENGSLASKVLNEDQIRDYFGQICKGIQYLHNQNIIHRDLKPENILLQNNLIKLCDFGWSAEVDINKQRDTLCGTIDYMAPEIMKGKYSFKVDTWSLGIILYELFHHCIPPKEFINFDCPLLAQDLIKKLLVPQEIRLSIEEVLQHPYLQYFQDKIDYNIFNQLDDYLEQQDSNILRMTEIIKPRLSKRVTVQQPKQQKSFFYKILDTFGCVNRSNK